MKKKILCVQKILKKIKFKRYVFEFSVDYNIIDTSNIIDINIYFMKNYDIKS